MRRAIISLPDSPTPIGAPDRNLDTDVVVIGAGPIGLTVANALNHHGIRFRILEQRTDQNKNSKANNVWSRPQELLASIGVRDAIAQCSYAVTDVNVLLNGHPLDSVPIKNVDSPYSAALYTGQDVIETTLAGRIEQVGVRIERGRHVRTLAQDAQGVDVVVDPADGTDGSVERIRCLYVVGADGTNSVTRDAINVDITDESLEKRATRQIDAKLSWRRPSDPNQLYFFTYRNGFAGIMPVWGGYHRLFFLEDEVEVADRNPTLAEMEARARTITGDPTLSLSDPIWFSHGRFSHGVAPTYSRQRVLLAGDAGHHTLPIGGQGMNAGIHDAVGLAWRLAMVLNNVGGPTVLESYNAERQQAHAELDADQTAGFKRLMYRSWLGDAALVVARKTVPNLGTKMFGADDLQQLAVAYPGSLLSEDRLVTRPWHRKRPKAGDRAPDARVTSKGETTTLFQHIYNPSGHTWGWSLLAFDGRNRKSRPDLVRAVAAASDFDWVHPHLVLSNPEQDEESDGALRMFDLDREAHGAYGLTGTPALVLIRPDGHIAFRAPADAARLLRQYCARVASVDKGELMSDHRRERRNKSAGWR